MATLRGLAGSGYIASGESISLLLMNTLALRSILLLILALGIVDAQAQKIYRWVDESGQVHFTQTPPPDRDAADTSVIEHGSSGQVDAACCGEVYRFALQLVGHMRRGMSSLEIYEIFPPHSYPNVVEVSNHIAARVDSDLSSTAIAALTRDACLNRSFQACRVDPGGAGQGGRGGSGSGVAIAAGLVLTNHHVVDGCGGVRVGADGDEGTILATDGDADLAVLRTGARFAGFVSVSASRAARLGESVVAAGYPLGDLLGSLNVTTGSVSADTGAGGDPRRFQLTAPVQPGSSGGPVLDGRGALLGIVVSRLNDAATLRATGVVAQNVNFAIQPGVIRDFLDRNDIPYNTGSKASSEIGGQEIAERARRYTTRVFCD